MSDTIYRPLFAMAEALEGAIKAKLPTPSVKSSEPPRGVGLLRPLAKLLKLHRYPDLEFDFSVSGYSDDICVGFLCTQCDMPHRDYIDGHTFAMTDRIEVANLFIDKLDEMLAKPCTAPVRGIDLGPAGKR